MSQVTIVAQQGMSGTVTSVTGGNNITITGTPTIDPTVNVSGTTNHSVLLGNSTGSINSLSVGSTGQLLQGASGTDPSWTGSPSVSGSITAGTSITASSGNITLTSGNIALPTTTSSIGKINWADGNSIHTFSGTGDSQFFGRLAGNFTNSSVGLLGIGTQALTAKTSGNYDIALGYQSMIAATSSSQNCSYGAASLGALLTGTNNVALGFSAGQNYTSSESNNILIGSQVLGTVGESNTTRIGSSSQSSCFISGIQGVSAGSLASVVSVNSSGQLGQTTITAGSGVTVTPSASAINISTGVRAGFQAYLSSTASGVTGDGTDYTIIFDTEIRDTSSLYNNTNGQFTVPTTGFYNLFAQITISGISSLMTTGVADINGINISYVYYFNPFLLQSTTNGFATVNLSTIAYLNASQIITVGIQISGGASNSANIVGTSGSFTSFGAVLMS